MKKKAQLSPKERAAQARLRLIAATKMKDQSSILIPLKKKNIGIPAVIFSFSAGFTIGFFPSISRVISQEGASLLRRWLTSRMSRG